MKRRPGISLFIISITIAISFSSCAQDTYVIKHKRSSGSQAKIESPVTRKATPVGKKYVIKNQRKRSLGQSGTFRRGKKSDLIL